MKKMISIFISVALLLLLTCCHSAEQEAGSEALTASQTMSSSADTTSHQSFVNTTSHQSFIGTSSNLSSALNDNTITKSSSAASVVSNPYIFQNERGETVHINPAPKIFSQPQELLKFLNTIDLQEKYFDVIADEGVCLFVKLSEHPKSKLGKIKLYDSFALTSKLGGGPIAWAFLDAPSSWCYTVVWQTSKKFLYKPITTSQDLYDVVKNIHSGANIPPQIITQDGKYYAYLEEFPHLYFIYDKKYLIRVSDWTGNSTVDDLILFTEDISFEKYSLK